MYDAGRFMRHDDVDDKKMIKIEPASVALSESIKRLKFPVGRLRTGTPPRISNQTIDYSGLEPDPGDEKTTWFSQLHSFNSFENHLEKIVCYITKTNKETHEIVMSNYHKAPKLGEDEHGFGNGPRYCPSIEKKMWMFPGKE